VYDSQYSKNQKRENSIVLRHFPHPRLSFQSINYNVVEC
jgi:hypothetical protein